MGEKDYPVIKANERRVIIIETYIDILEKKVKEFGSSCLSEEKEIQLEQLRREFVKKFPIDKLSEMTLEQYALGTDKYKDSFCYWIETKLVDLGDIHGSSSTKFGVYYGKRRPDKTIKWRWCKWTKNDFDVVKGEIVSLVEAGRIKDFSAIEKNRLSPMLKGKILSCYYPDKYVNVFSYEHIKYFLQKAFGVFEYPNHFEAQDLLQKMKSMINSQKAWSNLKLSYFLYTAYADVKIADKEEVNKSTPQIIGNELIPIESKSQYQIVESIKKMENNSIRHPKPDYEAIAKHNASIGKTGEKAVFEYEKKRLIEAGRKDLADCVEWVSLVTDSLGYDIKSFNEDGTERHIEVKTNTGAGETVSFYISAYEYYMLQMDPCYEILYVFGKKKKKVYHVDCTQLRDKFEQFAAPISYKVDFVTADIK